MTEEIRIMANNVLSFKHLGISDAMDRVIGGLTENNHDTYAAVFNEVQDILNPHGTGEDAANYDW